MASQLVLFLTESQGPFLPWAPRGTIHLAAGTAILPNPTSAPGGAGGAGAWDGRDRPCRPAWGPAGTGGSTAAAQPHPSCRRGAACASPHGESCPLPAPQDGHVGLRHTCRLAPTGGLLFSRLFKHQRRDRAEARSPRPSPADRTKSAATRCPAAGP